MNGKRRLSRGLLALAIIAGLNLLWLGYYSYQHVARSQERRVATLDLHRVQTDSFAD